MGKAQGRAPNGPRGGDEEAWSAIPDLQVESLRQLFVRFRREHRPRTRYPQALRAAVLAAVRSGAAEPELRRACGISAVQLGAWRRHEEAAVPQSALVRQPARVFSVVDETPDVSGERTISPTGEDVELRVGGWAVRIRRIDGEGA